MGRLELAALKLTVSWPSLGTIPEMFGAPGGPEGVKAEDGALKEPCPLVFTAATSNS
jgi:hypothetical protein